MKKNLYKIAIMAAGINLTAMPAGIAEAVTQIQIDNTLLGASHDISVGGTMYTLSEINGRVEGNNLFYSFSNFKIDAGDTAQFVLNTPSLANVISRVTGGSVSDIDGTLRMTNTGSAPSFFLINPAGITFGPSASVDVPGSFYASTASALNLSDSSQYAVHETQTSTLSAASPESFGFLGNEAGNINIDGLDADKTELAFKPGTDVAFVANTIHIENALIQDKVTFDGNINHQDQDVINLQIIATGKEATDIKIKPDSNTLAEQAANGDLKILNSIIDVRGNGGGYIAIQSGSFKLLDKSELSITNTGDNSPTDTNGFDILVRSIMKIDNSTIKSDVLVREEGGIKVIGKGGGSPMKVDVTGSLDILNRGKMITYARGEGAAGAIMVHAGQLKIDGADESIDYFKSHPGAGPRPNSNDNDLFDDNSILSKTFAQGNAGSVTVSVDEELKLLNTGKISSRTLNENDQSSGDAGEVEVTAKDITIDGSIFYDKNENVHILSGISASTHNKTNSGNAGNVTVKVTDSLKISNNGSIESDSFSKGDTGNVSVHAGQLTMSEGAFITSDLLDTGNAKLVTVTVDESLNMKSGSVIGARPLENKGVGGIVKVTAGQMVINESEVSSSTESSSSGDSGDVTVEVTDLLEILNSGSIKAKTSSKEGSAGNVTVKAAQIKIDGRVGEKPSGIFSNAEDGSSGKTGSINVTATNNIRLTKGAQISITNAAEVANSGSIIPTSITIDTPNLFLTDSQITTASSKNVNAGSINIFFTDLLSLNSDLPAIDSSREPLTTISTEAKNARGGDIIINDGDSIYLRNSVIQSSVKGQEGGGGGNITINAKSLVLDSGYIQANTVGGGANAGLITINRQALIIPNANLLTKRGGIDVPRSFEPSPSNRENFIEAVARNGVQDVPIQAPSPQLNLSGMLANLPIVPVPPPPIRNMCTVDEGSSLLQHGKGGLPMRAKDFLLMPVH